jgi:hypothetical protein
VDPRRLPRGQRLIGLAWAPRNEGKSLEQIDAERERA